MQGVFANRNSKRDFVLNEIQARSSGGANVFAAVAFFTEANVIDDLVAKGCAVKLVVRLGFPTNPAALERVMAHTQVQTRFFTGHSFHPKLYIFGAERALVGSANLTRSAILTNQEVVVSIDESDERFAELAQIFQGYWDEAETLTPDSDAFKEYKKAYAKFLIHENAADKLGKELLAKLGDTSPSNIARDKPKTNPKSLFTSDFRKTYQEGVAAFNIVRAVYEASGYRKVSSMPVRLEIDSFISFVRERKATGEAWRTAPTRNATEQAPFIASLIAEWRDTPWHHYEQVIVPERYPRFLRVFATAESLASASDDELFDALCTLHSFHDRFRFFDGGMPKWRTEFAAANDPKRTRESLSYLAFGQGDVVDRMANAIYDPRYKLNEFGRANVQELIGWRAREDLPIINGRTTKVLQYFGSRVRQL